MTLISAHRYPAILSIKAAYTVNWSQIVKELQAANITQKQMADACGCSQPTISDLARGEIPDPKHSVGETLVALHRLHVKAVA